MAGRSSLRREEAAAGGGRRVGLPTRSAFLSGGRREAAEPPPVSSRLPPSFHLARGAGAGPPPLFSRLSGRRREVPVSLTCGGHGEPACFACLLAPSSTLSRMGPTRVDRPSWEARLVQPRELIRRALHVLCSRGMQQQQQQQAALPKGGRRPEVGFLLAVGWPRQGLQRLVGGGRER